MYLQSYERYCIFLSKDKINYKTINFLNQVYCKTFHRIQENDYNRYLGLFGRSHVTSIMSVIFPCEVKQEVGAEHSKWTCFLFKLPLALILTIKYHKCKQFL